MKRTGILAFAVLLWLGASPATAAGTLAVYADEALRPALEDIATIHARRTGTRLVSAYDPSGRIAQAMEAGRQVDLVLVADDTLATRLAMTGLVEPGGPVIAFGRMAAVTSLSLPVNDWPQWLRAGAPGERIAVPDAAGSPWGETAAQVLAAHGLAARLQPRLDPVPTGAGALAAVAEGQAVFALVPAGLLATPPEGLQVALLADASHRPLPLRVLVTRQGSRRAPEAAAAFVEFLAMPAARDILRRHRYALP